MSVTFMTDVDQKNLQEQIHDGGFANYNKFDKNLITRSMRFNDETLEDEKHTSYFITDYIPCRTGKYVILSSVVNKGIPIRGIEYCDVDKKKLKRVSSDKISGNGFLAVSSQEYKEVNCCYSHQITVEDCHYIRLVLNIDLKDNAIVEIRDYDLTVFSEAEKDEDGRNSKETRTSLDVDYVEGRKLGVPYEPEIPYWRGRTIVWNGDSIPEGYNTRATYPDLVGKHLMCNTMNYSLGGSTLADNPDIQKGNTNYRNPLVVRCKNMPDNADLVCIAIGTNDWCYSYTDFGDMSSTGTNTFYGALKYLCEFLLNKYCGKPIVFFTPIKRVVYNYDRWDGSKTPRADSGTIDLAYYQTNECGKTLEDYANAIKEVCGFYGIPVLDLFNEGLINPLIGSIKTSCFPMNNEVYVRVENGNEVELTKAQADAYTGTGEIIVTSRRDGTHPNIHGHKILARRITGYIKQLADGAF